MNRTESELAASVAGRYSLHDVQLTRLDTLVNDVFSVSATEGRFAFKVYHRNRTPAAVGWEVELVDALRRGAAPVVQPVAGRDGYLQPLRVSGEERVAVLFSWAPGAKPTPSDQTYISLGQAAARIHRAAKGFPSSADRERFDTAGLVDEQLRRMSTLLRQVGRWEEAVALGGRLTSRLSASALDWGVCHMDLTLDNVHVADELTVFDFDSAGTCWRAMEPYGVLRFSHHYFEAWLTGYRSVRAFARADEEAVSAFAIIGDLRNVTWKLGLAESSRGTPLLTVEGLPAVVDGWLEWEAAHLRR